MNASTILRALRGTSLALVAACAVTLPLQANAATHGFSGGHAAFGGYHGGFGGYHGAYRGYYGHYGYGWRGGYYGWGGGWGWWGLPAAGLFLATLPFYYSTYWWNGVPYYYADDSYYVWSNSANGYVSVAPPPQVVSQAPAGTYPGPQATAPYAGAPAYGGAPGAANQLFVYPKNGQAADQIAKDRQECQAWAGSQASNGNDNVRAQTACLEARGYSVK